MDLRHPDWSRTNLWSPSILVEGGVYYMFYTGVEWGPDVNPDHPGAAYNWQRIGLGLSSDLVIWTRLTGDGLVLDGPHHEQYAWSAYGTEGPWRNDCRDPFVLKTGGRYLLFAAIRLYVGEALGPMAIAVARSQNLRDWVWVSPVPVTQGATAESPYVVEQGGYFYLFWTGAGSRIRVARSAQPDTGYVRIAAEGIDYGYAGEFLIEPDRHVWGAIGRGDELLEAYVLQLKKAVFVAGSEPLVRAEEFTQSDLVAVKGGGWPWRDPRSDRPHPRLPRSAAPTPRRCRCAGALRRAPRRGSSLPGD